MERKPVISKQVSFLFWNIRKRNLSDQIINLVTRHQTDVLLLAECQVEEQTLAEQLGKNWRFSGSQNEKIRVFSKFKPIYIKPVSEGLRHTIRLFNPPGYEEIIFVGLHLIDKRNNKEHIQLQDAIKISNEIKNIEDNFGNRKLIAIGDFNMNPFENGMVAHAAFNAVMTQELAKANYRQVQNTPYPFFYNPMWSFFGDMSKGTAGTYFYRDDFNWQMFDQVIFRPGILQNVIFDSLEIITTDGVSIFLTKNGRINDAFSDHLPIKFVLNL